MISIYRVEGVAVPEPETCKHGRTPQQECDQCFGRFDNASPLIPPKKGKRQIEPAENPWEDDDFAPGYGSESKGDRIAIRHSDPKVAAHVARMLIRNNMDYEATATAMMKAREGVSDSNIVNIARVLERSPHVQKALNDYLREIGLDNDAQKLLVGLAWAAALDRRNDKRWAPAMKLLGDWSGMQKKAGGEKPITLPLQGVDEGLKKMGLEMQDEDEAGDVDIIDLEEEES